MNLTPFRRYVLALLELASRYGGAVAESAFTSVVGPGELTGDLSEEALREKANGAEALVAHCDRIDALNNMRRDVNELVDAEDRLVLFLPWALTGEELVAEEKATARLLREAKRAAALFRGRA